MFNNSTKIRDLFRKIVIFIGVIFCLLLAGYGLMWWVVLSGGTGV